MWLMNKMLFGSSLALGTVIAISSYSWMGMWLGLEINLLSFVPLISTPKNMYSSESALKYFMAQAAASTMLLLALVILSSKSPFLMSKTDYAMMILNTSLLLKMGAAPLHFWFPEVMEGLSWANASILLTWQKIAPMVLFIYTNKTLIFIFAVVISCMIISGIMGQNHLSLRKIMAYSSINHIGWMIAASLFLEIVWLIYFVVYSIININIIVMFQKLNIFYMKQLVLAISYEPLLKLFFILNFLSLGGLPPFLGFLPKWFTIQILAESQFYLLAVIMIVATLATLFFYMRVTFSTFVLSANSLFVLPSQSNHKFFIMTANLVTLASLILSTLAFNFM
uniref:NADH-ubiquinone oxidoreductase chain 2 n=1 Tax=Prosopocoilus laterotarsus maedaorum TaxID=618908 RepID=A0A7H1DJJ4_9SCAR|nr:NADH dehydrogenase subunit 2 [Prosopocoilus laterotarsus]QNS37136.1 NADH dehydrogenase subunit 2 [Prosopocoilus laterotarsus maedaorum]UTM10027.1 NADH dehydrogenase subunit 2 [Prosopocoilus laterotarsus]